MMGSPTGQAAEWLAAFGASLECADYDAAIALFADDAHWSQLPAHPKSLLRCHRISFMPDRRAILGKLGIRAMLEATVDAARPRRWQVDGDATETDGIVDAWFTFETTVSLGVGQVRLESGRCWMLRTVTASDGICC
jgi:putative flavoprotein involved in K+ transport